MLSAQNILNTLDDTSTQVDDLMGVVLRSLADLDREHGTDLFTHQNCRDISTAVDLLQTLVAKAREDVQKL